MTDTLPCPACGAPNEPEAGRAQMTCSYCGANLAIPSEMRWDAPPRVEAAPERVAPPPRLEDEASEMLRKAQPVAVKALNTYAWWTWIRRVLPTCLIIALIILCACAAFGMLPFILNR